MKPGSKSKRSRTDWDAIKDRIDLAAVATGLLGPSPKRSGRRLLWRCPFHDDRDPSFQVDPQTRRWKCWPCDRGGDAPALVMHLKGVGFGEAVRMVAEQAGIVDGRAPAPWPRRGDGRGRRAALSPAEALSLVESSEKRLWTPESRPALEHLMQIRGLTEATIRRHRLGWVPSVTLPTSDGFRSWRATGVVIPWFDGDRLRRVKIRQPDGRKPRYAEAFADDPAIYPDPSAIRPGTTLIVVEGEFDAMLLAQELGDLASVATFGGTSSRADRSSRLAATFCPIRLAAHDADEAGDGAASAWSREAERVRPPAGKDWTEARNAGIDLRRWWVENHFPAEFDREERAAIAEFGGG